MPRSNLQQHDPRVTWHGRVQAGPFRITHKSYTGAFSQDWHEHDRASIDVVLAGSGAGVYAGEEIVSRAGSVEFFAAGIRHRFASHARGIRSMHIVMPADLPGQMGIDADTLARTLDASTALQPATALLAEFSNPEPDTLLLESLAMRMLEQLAPHDMTTDAGSWVTDIRDLLLDQPELASSLGQIARHVGRHPSHVARHFRLATGITVGEFGRRVRLSRAARSLAQRDAPHIVRIAHEQGFSDQSHFTRAFRAAYGCTPLAFRRRLELHAPEENPG